MALINTLRNKMGKVVVIVIAFAILSFVLADLLGPNSSILGGNDTEIGEIAGKDVSLEEFQAEVQKRELGYTMQSQRQPGENERPFLRQQAWDDLIVKYAFQNEYDEVGIDLTADEIWDMMQGKNVHPGIKQAYTNQETGEFDAQAFSRDYSQRADLPNGSPQKIQWDLFMSEVKKNRVRTKYQNLLVKTGYITSDEAEKEYQEKNNAAEVKYLYIPYYAINDSTVSPSDSELSAYYDENKEQYKVEENRDLDYVAFDIVPSAEDSAFVKQEISDLSAEFKTVTDDSIYASVNTDGLTFFGKYEPHALPSSLQANPGNLSVGDVKGPYLEGGVYKLFKVSEIFEDTTGYARASHILIKGDDDETKKEANRILREIKNGADFGEMAQQYGTDGTKSKGGDLGWFSAGRMVPEFESAVFGATKAGLLPNLVRTQYGYHIIKVDEVVSNTYYKIAAIERNIIASDETMNEIFRQADEFSASVGGIEDFKAKAEEGQLQVSPLAGIKPNDKDAGVLRNAREVVRWLFKDASKGDVSEVFELDDKYVVAVMTKEVEEGYKSLEDVKSEVEVKVKNQLKGDQIINKLSGLSGSLDEMASSYGTDATVYESNDLKLSSTSLPSVGFDPLAIGKAFSLSDGQKSAPFAGENGVLVIEMLSKTVAPEIADYNTYKTELEQSRGNISSYNIGEAIKKSADIVDKRYKFY